MAVAKDVRFSDAAAAVDRQIIESIQSGSEAALAQLYDRFADRMLGYAYRILENSAILRD